MLEEFARACGLILPLGSYALIFSRHFPVKMLLMLMDPTKTSNEYVLNEKVVSTKHYISHNIHYIKQPFS